MKKSPIKIAVRCRWLQDEPSLLTAAAEEADRLGYDSLWLPDHLVIPEKIAGSPESGHAVPTTGATGYYDAFVFHSYLAGRTKQIRFGTGVWVMGLRHPFIAARAIQSLDIVSGGRVEVGVGAGWVKEEFEAMGVDFHTRGKRLDETIEICRRLWTEKLVSHKGQHFSFSSVSFEPKPIQKGGPPIQVGGETDAAMRRAVTLGNGWYGRDHTPETAKPLITRLRQHMADAGRSPEGFEIAVRPMPGMIEDLDAWIELGVTRLVAAPWEKSGELLAKMPAKEAIPKAIEGIQQLAKRHLGA